MPQDPRLGYSLQVQPKCRDLFAGDTGTQTSHAHGCGRPTSFLIYCSVIFVQVAVQVSSMLLCFSACMHTTGRFLPNQVRAIATKTCI